MPDATPNNPEPVVLVLAPAGNDARNAAAVLDKASIRAEICASVGELSRRAGDQTGALLVSEEALDESSLASLLQYLVRQALWSDVPLILITSAGELKQQTHHILDYLGTRANVTLLEKPLRAITLISVVKAALRSRNHQYEVRKLLESYARATEESNMATVKFQAVFDQSGIFAGIMTIEGILVEANRLSLEVCGYRAEEVIGRPFWDCGWWRGSKELQEKIRAGITQATQGAIYAEELPYLWADGTQRLVELTLYPIRDEAGKVIFLHPTGVDITERKQGEKALRDANQNLQTVLGSIADGLAVLDKNWRYIYFNEQGARIIGMRPEQLLGGNVWEMFPHTIGTKFYEGYHRAVKTGQPVQFEEFYPEPLNLWLECRCYPSNEGLAVYFHDITARKQAEAILRQNEALFSALVELAPTGVYVVDAQFKLQKINALALPAFEKVYPRIGRDFSEVMTILWGPEVGGEILKIFRHTMATGERYISPRFSEYREDLGEERSYEWETQRVTLPDGQHGVVCYFSDITERMRSENALRNANALLADKAIHLEDLVQQRTAKLLETIGELEAFSYSIAHDMRAPLRSLQAFSDLLLAEHSGKLEADGVGYLRRIAKAAVRMDKLIQDVLNYSRVVREEFRLEKMDVEELLRDILDTYPMLATDKAEILLQGPFPPVLGNEAMLTQVFSNLLGNAIKFVPPGVKPRIKVWAEAHENLVRLFVQDNGIGLEAYQHQKIFGMFEQVNKEFEGTGIGLAIVKKAVERMNGKVGVYSEPGRGSTFWIELQPA